MDDGDWLPFFGRLWICRPACAIAYGSRRMGSFATTNMMHCRSEQLCGDEDVMRMAG
jgi:hypothetical protein